MVRQHKPTGQDLMRLDAIAKHLKIKSRYPQPTFTADVTAACMARIAPVVDKLLPCTGEQIALGLGDHLCLTFEEVHGPHDVVELEDRYLKGKKEIGFAQLRGELDHPGVDALLFERMNAKERDPDRWVAVLNLQETAAKAYWNRFHELSHRIAEPPQGILPFRRHQFEAANPVESLIDAVASEFAFYGPAFRPLVERYAKKNQLGFNVIEAIRAICANGKPPLHHQSHRQILAAARSDTHCRISWPAQRPRRGPGTAHHSARLQRPRGCRRLHVLPEHASSGRDADSPGFPDGHGSG